MKNSARFFNLLTGENRVEAPKNVVNEAKTEATIYLYDEINNWWSGAEWFVGVLNSMLDIPEIHLRINSPGGDIFEARAMQMAMVEHPANITAHIDGLAASAASFLIRGANKRVIADGGFLMIHQGRSGMWGTAQQLLSRGEALEKIDNSIIKHYAKVTNESEEMVRAWVEKETWFDSAEALEHGFVDEIINAAPVENKFDLSAVYNHVPEKIKNWAADSEQNQDPEIEQENKIDEKAVARERELALAEILF